MSILTRERSTEPTYVATLTPLAGAPDPDFRTSMQPLAQALTRLTTDHGIVLLSTGHQLDILIPYPASATAADIETLRTYVRAIVLARWGNQHIVIGHSLIGPVDHTPRQEPD